VQLDWRRRNGLQCWAGVERGDEMKKIRLAAGNWTKRAKGIQKKGF
jgi:hypothetical protein